MNTRIRISLMLVFLFTAIFFSGCSLDLSGSRHPNVNGGMGDITTGIVSGNSNDVGKDDLGKPPEAEGMDEKNAYTWMQGIKVAYDATNQIIETSKKSYCGNLIEKLNTEFMNGYENFSITEFMNAYPSEDYDISDVSRVAWIYNLIQQYQVFSKMLLTDIVGSFGLGYAENHTIESVMYPKFYFVVEKNPTIENQNSINFKSLEKLNTLQFENPNYNTAYEYSAEQYIDFDLANKIMSIGSNQWSVNIPTELTTTFTSWKLNSNQTQSNSMYEFDNPIYNATAEIGDFCGYQKLYIIGEVGDGVITYSLSTTPIEIVSSSIDKKQFLNDYIEKYYNYLTYKIFENSSLISLSNQYDGVYSNIKSNDIISLIPDYLSKGGCLGFVEKNWTPQSVGDFDFVTNVTKSIMKNFVGYEDIATETIIKEIVEKRLNQYVLIDRNEAFSSDKSQEKAQLFFPVCYNIEWKDYSIDELFDKNNADGFEAQYSNIVDIVFMVNENLEKERFFDSLWLSFMAKENDVDLKSKFRYVLSGKEKIFDALDYAKMSENTKTEESEEVGFTSTFNGKIKKIEGDIDLDYVDAHTLYLIRDCVPHINEFVNKELILKNFKNNSKSNFIQCTNIRNNYYQYSNEKKSFYYNDTSQNNDFIELSFDAKTDSFVSPSFSFSFYMFGLEEKQAE